MPSTSSDDDEKIEMARVVDEDIRQSVGESVGYDPRPEFLKGFQEGRPEAAALVKKPSFEDELRALLNRHSREGVSNTPDYILAKFLLGCLMAFETAVNVRDQNAR